MMTDNEITNPLYIEIHRATTTILTLRETCDRWFRIFKETSVRADAAERALAEAREERDALMDEVRLAVEIGLDVYRAVWREGWEPGKTKNEAFDRLHAWLCDTGHDPNALDAAAKVQP